MQQIDKILQFSRYNKTVLGYDFLQNYQKHKFNTLVLLSRESPVELCRLLKISITELEKIINTPVYEHYVLEKKRGGKRHIFAPEKQLKRIQKRLNYFLQSYYLWIKPSEVHGFVINPRYLGSRCNIVDNAAAHTGKKHVLNIDLKDFFPSISAKRVYELFLSDLFAYPKQIATALTLLTTYKGILPTGAPTSPAISNFICLDLDKDLIQVCKQYNINYTRYADDLTFSANEYFTHEHIAEITKVIQSRQFEVNNKKFRVQSSSSKQIVTGLVVNEKVNVDRKLLKKMRAMLHDMTTNGIDTATQRHFNLNDFVTPIHKELFINRLRGYLNFAGQVRGKNDTVYLKLKQSFDTFQIENHGLNMLK